MKTVLKSIGWGFAVFVALMIIGKIFGSKLSEIDPIVHTMFCFVASLGVILGYNLAKEI